MASWVAAWFFNDQNKSSNEKSIGSISQGIPEFLPLFSPLWRMYYTPHGKIPSSLLKPLPVSRGPTIH
jgi:hypothetical protein